MYLQGYRIKTSSEGIQSITLPKWDFGGDKPWTNSIWNKTLNAVREIDETNYPLTILDLDNTTLPEIQLKNKTELNNWLNKAFK
jgi:hypothetical protein